MNWPAILQIGLPVGFLTGVLFLVWYVSKRVEENTYLKMENDGNETQAEIYKKQAEVKSSWDDRIANTPNSWDELRAKKDRDKT